MAGLRGGKDGESDGSVSLMGELIMRLFDARTSTHVAHLQSRSYAEHVALAGFYEAVLGLADSLAEGWQGVYGELLQYPAPAALCKDPVKCLKDLRVWIDENRMECCDDSEIQNTIDEVMSLIDGTVYKLRFLK